MTPKEKAQSLFTVYHNRYKATDSCFGLCNDKDICDGTGNGCGLWNKYAKESALITVEQAILYHPFPNEPDERDKRFHEYWNNVKKEIESL